MICYLYYSIDMCGPLCGSPYAEANEEKVLSILEIVAYSFHCEFILGEDMAKLITPSQYLHYRVFW